MKLHVLGTAGYHPNESRQTTCLMIPELGIVFDAGTSFYRVRDLLRTDELDIFLTHTHLDHVVGLTYLLDVMPVRDSSKVRVHGDAAKLEAVRQNLFHPMLFPVEPPFTCCPAGQAVTVSGVKISHFELDHPGGSLGYRLDGPRSSAAVITDTTARADADYVKFIEGVDVLFHECNFRDGMEELAELTGHSCTSGVCQVAKAAKVGRLVLIHMNPLESSDDPVGLGAARAVFNNCEIASDQMVVDI